MGPVRPGSCHRIAQDASIKVEMAQTSGEEISPLLARPLTPSLPPANHKLLANGKRSSLLDSEERDTPDMHSRFRCAAFFSDIQSIQNGTVPVSLLIATIISVLCGIAAFLYYTCLEFLLQLLWKTLPEFVVSFLHWLWISCGVCSSDRCINYLHRLSWRLCILCAMRPQAGLSPARPYTIVGDSVANFHSWWRFARTGSTPRRYLCQRR